MPKIMNAIKSQKENELQSLFSHKPFITATEVKSTHYDVYLDEEIGEPEHYRDLVATLFNASEGDSVVLFINNTGGHLTTALSIIEGIKNTAATVRGVVVCECHSAASLITMYCHEIVVLDSANMMIHTANFGSVGSTGNVKAHTDFTVKQVETLLDDAYAGFLHKDELAKVKAGVELWFDSTQIRERIGTRVKHLEAQQAAKAAAEEKEAKPKRSRKTT
jgi:ATP-dependent protease ClpP protease subunit